MDIAGTFSQDRSPPVQQDIQSPRVSDLNLTPPQMPVVNCISPQIPAANHTSPQIPAASHAPEAAAPSVVMTGPSVMSDACDTTALGLPDFSTPAISNISMYPLQDVQESGPDTLIVASLDNILDSSLVSDVTANPSDVTANASDVTGNPRNEFDVGPEGSERVQINEVSSTECHLTPGSCMLPAPDQGLYLGLYQPSYPEVYTMDSSLDVAASQLLYPSVYVSPSGLLTVIMQHEIAVEMTLDRALRVVNHRHRTVAAISNNGSTACVHHPVAKLYQEGMVVQADVFWNRRALLSPDTVSFAIRDRCYDLVDSQLMPTARTFTDISQDMSVSILFSSSGYGPSLVPHLQTLVQQGSYSCQRDDSVYVNINGIKIHQTAKGDVTVRSGRKVIRVSPTYGSMYVESSCVQMALEMNWSVKFQRGKQRLNASFTGLVLSDGDLECGVDQYLQPFVQPGTPILCPPVYPGSRHLPPCWERSWDQYQTRPRGLGQGYYYYQHSSPTRNCRRTHWTQCSSRGPLGRGTSWGRALRPRTHTQDNPRLSQDNPRLSQENSAGTRQSQTNTQAV